MERNREYAKKILDLNRKELSVTFPFLTPAIYALDPEEISGSGFKYAISPKGDYLYDPDGLVDDFMAGRDTAAFFLHSVLHCLFLHPFMAPSHGDRELWDRSCDNFVRDIMCRMGKDVPSESAFIDDHCLWNDPFYCGGTDRSKSSECLIKWERIKGETELFLKRSGKKSEGRGDLNSFFLEVLENIERRHMDYGDFLKSFGSFEEITKTDPDSFDFSLYTYGLELYGDMPIIEPLEYCERKTVRDFAVALDTSLSCSTELIRQFLERTYDILFMSMESGEQKRMMIFQCDNEIKDETVIRDREELNSYMSRVSVQGRGGTDFRPVFKRIEELKKNDCFSSLKGLLYFTDGDGIYPEKPPKYKTAFVMPRGRGFKMVPPWAMKVELSL